MASRAGAAKSKHKFVRGFGPGLVSGASANDPTTVGSLAIVGAGTGYGLAWLVVLLLPMLAIVQAIAASVATLSQTSVQQAIARTFGRKTAMLAAVSIVAIGLFTLAADVRAGAQALTLLVGLPYYYFVVPLVVVAAWLLATKSYLRIERILASFTLVFLCYVASAIYARPDWGAVLHSIVVPRFELSPIFLTGAVALLGTTLTGYVYFWESIEVSERRPLFSEVWTMGADAALGMCVAGSSFLFVLVATAATIGKHHLPIQTAAEAAAALRPLAGRFDQGLFGIGLLASAAIAIPVIAATNGYVIAQAYALPASLALRPREAPFFYNIVFGSLALAAALALLPVPTLALLYWVSVAAGIATPLTLALMLLVARDARAMRGRPIGIPLACAGWVITVVVTASSLAFIASAVRSF